MTDAEKLDRIRQIIADQERLEAHGTRDGEQLAQASAFGKIQRFLYTEEGWPGPQPKRL